MDDDVLKIVKACETCQALPKSFKSNAQLPESIELPCEPWEKLCIDIKGPVYDNPSHSRFAICVIDYYSKWPEVLMCANVTTSRIVSFLETIFGREGIPKYIVSDNGAQFISKEFAEFLKVKGIEHIRTSYYFPSSNGLVERFNSNLKNVFLAAKIDKIPVDKAVIDFLSVYRSTPHSVTGLTPSLLLHGREIITQLSVRKPIPKSVRFEEPAKFKIGETVRLKHPRTKKITKHEIVGIKGKNTFVLSEMGVWNGKFISR